MFSVYFLKRQSFFWDLTLDENLWGMFATLLLCGLSRLLRECWVHWWRDNIHINVKQWQRQRNLQPIYLLWLRRRLSTAHADVSSQTPRHAAPAEGSEIPEEFSWFQLPLCICKIISEMSSINDITCYFRVIGQQWCHVSVCHVRVSRFSFQWTGWSVCVLCLYNRRSHTRFF